MLDDFDRPGPDDLVTPFLFVPHGSPDPVEWKRAHPGWASFPATFVPHPRPIPKWKIINGQRWPLDKKGRPWPKTRYGRPTCPFDELPPGMPAPGTQYELLRKFDHPTLFWEGEPTPTVAEIMAIGAKSRAERAAAAPPPPIGPKRAYDGDGLGPVRDYMDAMKVVDQQLREFAAAARQRSAVTARQSVSAESASVPSGLDSQQHATGASGTPPDNITASDLPTVRRIMTDAAPDPVLEGRQYAAVPLALIPPAIELAPVAAAAIGSALGALLGIGATAVLNEARKPLADATPRPTPVAVPPLREGETPADILMPDGQPVGERGNRKGDVRNLPGGKAAAEELFDRLTKDGTPDTSTTYPGVRRRTREGKFIGYRETSTSGSPAIDIIDLGLKIKKLHFPRSSQE